MRRSPSFLSRAEFARLRGPALVTALLIALSGASPAVAQTLIVPPDLNFQALLLNEAGEPMEGDLAVVVEIFPSPERGEPLYREEHLTIAVGGVFQLALGTGQDPIPADGFGPELFRDWERWLQITINDEVMMPRHPFRSVVYALVAQHAATVESVGADSIEAGAIGPEQIAPGAIYPGALQPDAITETHIMHNAIVAEHLAPGSIHQGALQFGIISETHIAPFAVGPKQLAPDSVYPGALQPGAITYTNIMHNAVVAEHLAPGSVHQGALQYSIISGTHLAPHAVGPDQLAPGAVYPGALQSEVVTYTNIMHDAIREEHLAPESVYAGALQHGAFTTTHMMKGAVTSAVIADGSVAGADIAPSAITSDNVLRRGGLYSSKSEIYTRESEPMDAYPGEPVFLRATCDDGDDLPLQGFCRILTGSGTLLGTSQSNWEIEGEPAIFECMMEARSQGTIVAAAIACIGVGDTERQP